MKLKDLLKESWTQQPKGLTTEEKREFMEAVARFNEYGTSIYREGSLRDITETMGKMVQRAQDITTRQTEGSFDGITVGRHMKGLSESFKLFEKTAMEMNNLQQRLEACYEEIGGTLSKYYDIHEIAEASLDPVGSEDSDIDNDGDSDEADDYLANRRDVVGKSIKQERGVGSKLGNYMPSEKDIDNKYKTKKRRKR